MSVVSVNMLGGNFLHQELLVKLNVQNPNDRAMPVTRVNAELRVEGDEVARGVSTQSFVVPAHGGSQFDMTITANMALALLKLAGSNGAHAETIDYELTGGASIDLPFLRNVPFHQRGSFQMNLR